MMFAFIGVSRGNAVVIGVTALITALVVSAVWLVWVRTHPETVVGDRRRTMTPTFLLLIISISMNGIGLLGVSAVTSDTNTTVQFIEEQTSPERAQQQEQFLNGVIIRIDCDGQRRDQREIDGLVAQGLINPYTVITDDCTNTSNTTEP